MVRSTHLIAWLVVALSACAGADRCPWPEVRPAEATLPWVGERSAIVRGRFGGTELLLLLDTGYPRSAMSSAYFIEEGALELGSARVERLRPDLLLQSIGVDGVVGADVLGQLPIQFDARARQTRILADHAAMNPTRHEATCETVILVDATIEGRAARFILDTGADITFVRSALFPSDDRPQLRNIPASSTYAGTFIATATRVRSLTVGDAHSQAQPVLTAPQIDRELDRLERVWGTSLDGFLGWTFLQEFEVTFSQPLQLSRFDTQTHWTRPFVGIGIRRAPSTNPVGIRVEDFLDPSPAQQAGLQIGDVILAVDGRPVDGDAAIATESTQVVLDIRRGSEALTLTVPYVDLLPDPSG